MQGTTMKVWKAERDGMRNGQRVWLVWIEDEAGQQISRGIGQVVGANSMSNAISQAKQAALPVLTIEEGVR